MRESGRHLLDFIFLIVKYALLFWEDIVMEMIKGLHVIQQAYISFPGFLLLQASLFFSFFHHAIFSFTSRVLL